MDEKLLPDLVEGVKVGEVGQEHLRLDDVVQRAAGRGERVLQLRENVAGLLLDRRAVIRKGRVDPRLRGDPGLVRAGDLAGREDKVASTDGLGGVGERLPRARGERLARRWRA